MENKTSYTLQDAKDEVAKERYFDSWQDFIEDGQDWRDLRDANDEAAELYKSKATEELRKERDSLKIELSNYAYQIDRAKRDRDKAEELNGKYANQFHNLTSKIIRLEESNKELVEALKDCNIVLRLRVSGYDKKNKLFNHVQALIQKSEGEIKK